MRFSQAPSASSIAAIPLKEILSSAERCFFFSPFHPQSIRLCGRRRAHGLTLSIPAVQGATSPLRSHPAPLAVSADGPSRQRVAQAAVLGSEASVCFPSYTQSSEPKPTAGIREWLQRRGSSPRRNNRGSWAPELPQPVGCRSRAGGSRGSLSSAPVPAGHWGWTLQPERLVLATAVAGHAAKGVGAQPAPPVQLCAQLAAGQRDGGERRDCGEEGPSRGSSR